MFASRRPAATVAAPGTQIKSAGRAGQYATHTAAARGFGWRYAAPTAPGEHRIFAIGTAANERQDNNGDAIAFHGSDPTSRRSACIYVGANAPADTRLGNGWPAASATGRCSTRTRRRRQASRTTGSV
ncbi:MAG: hypothetical protein IPM29_03210 [Planctomycetes bacterium]|nr:hypothetical protein [Planctomycetota bacterium]